MPPTSEALPASIQSRLRSSSYIGLRRIHVAMIDDTVVLSGEVSSHYLRQIAQTLAQGIVADNRLRFELAVNDSAAHQKSNAVFSGSDSPSLLDAETFIAPTYLY